MCLAHSGLVQPQITSNINDGHRDFQVSRRAEAVTRRAVGWPMVTMKPMGSYEPHRLIDWVAIKSKEVTSLWIKPPWKSKHIDIYIYINMYMYIYVMSFNVI